MTDAFTHIENGAHGGAFGDNPIPAPTDAQCQAGNYKVGRITVYGLPIAIEQPRGTYRTGVSQDGTRWTSRMAAHYGYINGTKGNDGDCVDCFIGFYPQSERAFVINQNLSGSFDEHKVFLCFPDEDSARRAYQNSYERGWSGLASIVPLSISQLKWWLKNGDMSRPLRADALPPEGLEAMTPKKVQWNSDALPYDFTLDQVLYEIRRADAGGGLLLDAVCAQDILEGSDGVLTLDALVSPYGKLDRKMEVLRGVMERSGSAVKPVAMQITEPFKQRGVANVAAIFELSDGQTISIYFHNPDTTPNKLAPTDELISWKWLLNKKDITIVVAPERGEDLNVREVARRILKLAEKNSPAFKRANTKRAEYMASIQTLKDEISGLEEELTRAQHDLEVAKVEAEDRIAAAPATPASTPAPAPVNPEELSPAGKESKVKTAKGTEVVTGFAVVEADSLITSHDPATGDVNPEFPQELQPRDRGRETSRAWVLKTAANLDPEQLGKTRRADTGAPIVGPDRVVESGNGRTMAIIEAYRIGKAGEYRSWLESEADYFGLSPEKIKAMKRPVLVRIRTSQVNRAEFAVEANQDDKLAMTATEKARADANRLTDDMIALMTDNGDLNAAANTAFLSAFLRSLGDAEAAQYSTSDGKPTSSLIARVQAAIFAKAYNDDRLLELTADAAKPEIANIISALNFAAPEFIQSAALDPVAAGGATKELTDSIEASLNEQAVASIIGATNVIKQAKESGMQVEEFVKQQGLFGDLNPSVAAMAVFIAKNNRSAKRMGAAFKAMATFVKGEIKRRQTTDMFGAPVPIGFPEIIAAANRELDRMFGEGAFAIETVDMFVRPPEPAPNMSAAKIPLSKPAQEVTLAEFSKAATATKLENHGRKWEVSYVVNGQKMTGFSDADTAEDAIRDDHKASVSNAIYANSPDAPDFMKGTPMPPAEVLAEYPDLAKWAAQITAAPPPSAPAPTEAPQMTADRALFQSVIDGTVPDILAPELADQLEAAFLRTQDKPEMAAMFERAVTAYQNAMLAATATL